ncbi:hypothetical protein CXF85_12020 [Colwellia sp. 75C3]|uniref:hypothetical protein n=1 Tax=Colwellia sp. 75C3 TaxID=888425 RepID=UPI000C31F4B6|nr:hypothetical protein [Colwellia sp. 75C3]PKG83067.1 hypothetical protein CXF85_12020 [Colwellia sp. 75C3]
MNYKQPFYTLRLNSQNCGYRITVNGCFIEEQRHGEMNVMEYPINQWLKNGDNLFDIYHINIPTPAGITGLRNDGKLTLELCVRENSGSETTIINRTIYDGSHLKIEDDSVDYTDIEGLLSSLSTSFLTNKFDVVSNKIVPSDTGEFSIEDYQVKKGEYNHALQTTQNITLPAPFPLWRFFKADELTNHNELSDEQWEATRKNMINEVYQPVWKALRDNDAKALKALFLERGKEYDQAFYKEEGKDVYEMVVHLRSLVDNEDLSPVRDLNINACDVAVAFNNKLTWLHDWDLSLSEKIEFEHLGTDLLTSIPLKFARFDGKWEIVR